MARRIRYYGDPILRKRTEEVTEFNTPFLKELVLEMDELMKKNDGMGLAANQAGESVRLFITRKPVETEPNQWNPGELEVFINPVLSNPTQETWLLDEGCLSLDHIAVNVERPLGITIQAYDLEGKPFSYTETGIVARLFMHENDHLNGVLTIDRTSKKERARVEPKLKKLKAKYKK